MSICDSSQPSFYWLQISQPPPTIPQRQWFVLRYLAIRKHHTHLLHHYGWYFSSCFFLFYHLTSLVSRHSLHLHLTS